MFFEQFFFYNLMVIIRCFIIAVRYGYASKFRIRMISKTKQDLSYITRDLLLPTWMNFHPPGLDVEIEAAMWRNQVEEQTFKFSFIEELNDTFSCRMYDKDHYTKISDEFSMKEYRQSI